MRRSSLSSEGNGDITITDGAGRVLRVITPEQAVKAAIEAASKPGRKGQKDVLVIGIQRRVAAYLTELDMRNAEQAAAGR